MKIKEIMNKAISVEEDISLKQAAKIMSDKNIGSLVVIKKGEVAGIITERDILKSIPDLDKKVSSVMSKKIITIEDDEDLDEAALVMTQNKIRRLPVITEEGKLIGIVTSTDIIAHSEEIGDEFLFD